MSSKTSIAYIVTTIFITQKIKKARKVLKTMINSNNSSCILCVAKFQICEVDLGLRGRNHLIREYLLNLCVLILLYENAEQSDLSF